MSGRYNWREGKTGKEIIGGSNRRYGNWDQERSGGTGGRRGKGDGENNDEDGEDGGGRKIIGEYINST